MPKFIHRAKYVLAEPDLLVTNAEVHISDDGRISSIESRSNSPSIHEAEIVDWGAALIIPGLINAHAHLELTSLQGQLTRFQSFTDWVLQLIEKRRLWTKEDFLSSVRAGVEAVLKSGTTLVGDVSASGWSCDAGCSSGLRRVVFEESTAFPPSNMDSALSQVEQRLDQSVPDPLLVRGVSPHAPYSVSPELYRRLADLSRERRFLLATHIAETASEIQFLQFGTGEFRELLLRLGVLPDTWKPPQLSPIAYLDSLGVLGPFTILIHCNYLDWDSVNRILASQGSVVYCPRSHDFFGHEQHPVRQLLDLGINVALGTDSLASNRSLSMLDEMRHLFRSRKDLKPEEIFRLATVNGAAALKFGRVLGCLRPGYWADLAVLKLPENTGPRHLPAQVLEGTGEWIATIVQGKVAKRSPDYS
jgi:cytosine/adenosine deaminase-related metal-dependent hydrolase